MAFLLCLSKYLCKIKKEIISSEDSGEVKMGLFGQLISTGITTAAINSTIKVIGDAASKAISSLPDTEVIAVGNAGPLLVKPTRPAEEYHGEKAIEMAKELVGVGFESVALQPVCTLGKLTKHSFGKVQSISINGKKEFKGIMPVPSSSYIVITYYDFKKNVDQDIIKKYRYNIPSVYRRGDELRSVNNSKKMRQSRGSARIVVSS